MSTPQQSQSSYSLATINFVGLIVIGGLTYWQNLSAHKDFEEQFVTRLEFEKEMQAPFLVVTTPQVELVLDIKKDEEELQCKLLQPIRIKNIGSGPAINVRAKFVPRQELFSSSQLVESVESHGLGAVAEGEFCEFRPEFTLPSEGELSQPSFAISGQMEVFCEHQLGSPLSFAVEFKGVIGGTADGEKTVLLEFDGEVQKSTKIDIRAEHVFGASDW